MDINLDPGGIIQTTTYEDYLYKSILLAQQFENDPILNPGNISNITSSETHDNPSVFNADIAIPCLIDVNSVLSDFYLPITDAEFTNGITGDLANLTLFQSLFEVVTTLARKEVEIYGSSARRLTWSIQKNTELTSNNSIFNASIELDLIQTVTSINGQTISYWEAKALS